MGPIGLLSRERTEDFRRADQARESLLSRLDAELTGVRPMVARSWYRSRAAGVDGSRDQGFMESGRVDEHTLASAEPHLRKLDEVAADLGGYVSLTAPNGALINPVFLRSVDSFPEGYSLLEESCGSNGEGLALEEGRGVWLAPEEHFREDMRGNWCFGSLIRDPFHNRVRAVVGMTFPESRVSRIDPASTLLMLEGVSSRIEHDIASRTSSKERALLNEYLTVSRRRGDIPVIAMDGKNSLMNGAATTALEENDLAIVAGYAKSVMSTGESASTVVSLHGTGESELTVTAVPLSAATTGAIVTIRPRHRARTRVLGLHPEPVNSAAPDSGTIAKLGERLSGTSPEFARTMELAASVIDNSRSATIIGESGTGKRRLAGAIAALRGSSVFVDARRRTGAHEESFRDHLKQAIAAEPDTLIIGNADQLVQLDSIEMGRQLAAHPEMRLLMTASRPTDVTVRIAERHSALEITVPSLRHRREDIPLLAAAIARELGERTLSRKLLAALTNAEWPRNVDQLRTVVANTVERARGAEATVDDLPQGFQRMGTTGRLSRLEEAEYSELRAALQEAAGNRRQAAEMLQIGRSTLYRRMDFFRSRGLDV